ncbi:MAG: MFS transporter [Actinocrinis sp.]
MAFFALGVGTASIGAALPDLRRVFDLGSTGGNTLVSAYSLGALIAIVTCGALRTRLRATTAMAVLLAVYVVGASAMGLAPTWTGFYAATPITGLGYGGLVLYLNSIVARRFAHRSFLMLMLVNAVYGLGAIVGPLIVGIDHARPQTVFVISAAIAILSAPMCGMGREPSRADIPTRPTIAATTTSARARVPLRVRIHSIVPFLVFGFFYAGMETGTGAWESTHLTWTGHSTSEAAKFAALFWAGLCVGRFVLPFVIRDRSPRIIIRVALSAALFTFAAAAAPAVTPYAYTLSGFCLAPVLPAVLQWVAQRVEDNQAANSMVLTASMAGSVALPSAIGQLATPDTPAAIPLFLVVFALAGLITTFLAGETIGASG